MRRFASEIAGVSLLFAIAACATYSAPEQLGPGNPDGSQGGASTGNAGSGGSAAGKTGAGGTTSTAGAPGAGGTAPSQGGTAGTATGGQVNGGTSGSGGALGSAGKAGSGAGGDTSAADGGAGGAPDVPTDPCPVCTALKGALVHRYDFEGTGTAVRDRVGNAHGTVQGATLSTVNGKGAVVLSGGTTGPYVDLPNGILSSLTNATLEAWVTWGGGNAWQRIFDFGDSTDQPPENNPAAGKSYLFLTPITDAGSGAVMRAVYSLNGGLEADETRVSGTTALPQTLAQVAVVVDSKAKELRLYLNGVSVGSQAFTGALADVNDVNAWLGRSQYDADPELTGTFHDFRIYGAALSASQIAASFAAGPDPAFLLE